MTKEEWARWRGNWNKYNCRTCKSLKCPVFNDSDLASVQSDSGDIKDTNPIIGVSATCGLSCHSEMRTLIQTIMLIKKCSVGE
jgi:hypothetical protein